MKAWYLPGFFIYNFIKKIKMDNQKKFDALVQEIGAEAVLAAIYAHVKPNSGTGCTNDGDCGKGYYCSNGNCVLKVGKPIE